MLPTKIFVCTLPTKVVINNYLQRSS